LELSFSKPTRDTGRIPGPDLARGIKYTAHAVYSIAMQTVAVEMVPPRLDSSLDKAVEEGYKLAEQSRVSGITELVRHVMIPGMIPEEEDRPVEMKPRMDTLDFWRAIRPELGGIKGLCTQVTAYHSKPDLAARLGELRDAGMEGIAFVGVPRTMADGEGPGMAPTDALAEFTDVVANRGGILIPTREGEQGRFKFKCERGATYGMTQLLYSDAIVAFLQEFARATDYRPDILLSFGFVPGIEDKVKLIDWLIKDPGNSLVEQEQDFVARLARSSFEQRKIELVDLYKRIVDGVAGLGFPLSIHLEAPYGVSKPAFDTFSTMLDYWAPHAAS